MDDEIRGLLKEVILKELQERMNGGALTQEEKEENGKKRKLLIDQLNDADRNVIEQAKIEVEKDRNDIEREKIQVEKDKIELEREKVQAEKETSIAKAKWDFLGKAVTGGLTLIGTVAGLLFLNRWTKWGFIQEEFGSIAGKTMNNVMREWRIKRI